MFDQLIWCMRLRCNQEFLHTLFFSDSRDTVVVLTDIPTVESGLIPQVKNMSHHEG